MKNTRYINRQIKKSIKTKEYKKPVSEEKSFKIKVHRDEFIASSKNSVLWNVFGGSYIWIPQKWIFNDDYTLISTIYMKKSYKFTDAEDEKVIITGEEIINEYLNDEEE